MRPHRRRDPLEHVLVAGELTELDSIRALLGLLPESTYGQAFVETDETQQLPPIASPPRVTVTRVVRGPGLAPGDALSAAVASWVAEWMPEEPDPAREISLWIGTGVTGGVPATGARLERL